MFTRHLRASSPATSRLTPDVIEIIKATAPVVAPAASEITRTFYPLMFQNNPEVAQFFNASNQRKGRQPQALADAVVGYASNIENLSVLGPAVSRMVEKHCALNVHAEHYGVVHENLMKAIGQVLGDVVTPEIAHAWSESVLELADLLIAAEKARYDEVAAAPGGWRGSKNFVVSSVQETAANIVSVHFRPSDDSPLPTFAKPGQYVSVAANPTTEKWMAPRHYTITGMDPERGIRITVRKHQAHQDTPAGVMSSYIHSLKEGDLVPLNPPFGAAVYDPTLGTKDVFVSAGIGITPTLSMLPAAISAGRDVAVIHGCESPSHFPHRDEIESSGVPLTVAYPESGDEPLSADDVVAHIADADQQTTQIYLTGPVSFVTSVHHGLVDLNIPSENIHHETFGPHISL